MNKDAKIYVAGHCGLVGSALVRCLESRGHTNIVTRTRKELDLTRQADVEDFFRSEKPEYVFLAAAKVGGIWANNTYPAEFSYSNLAIQSNVVHAAWQFGVNRLIFLGSSCIYPRECPQPIKEEYLLTGTLEPTNEPYALAKIAGISQCESYNRQYGTKFLAVMPTNLYGPNDNFDLETSHVLPALIRKFHLAKLASAGDWHAIESDEAQYGEIPEEFMESLIAITQANGHPVPSDRLILNPLILNPAMTLWGTGSPRREFLHVDDLADACVHLIDLDDGIFTKMINENGRPIVNIGCGKDLTIKELAGIAAEVVGYRGDTQWDHSKPDGTPRKLLDIGRLLQLGWKPRIALQQGMKETYSHYQRRVNSSQLKEVSDQAHTANKVIAITTPRGSRKSPEERVALITGITGQDGAYLAELLIEKGYTVHGIKRRASLFNTQRVDHLYQDPHQEDRRFILHYGDLTDATNLIRIIQETQPDEIYNLAAQSHVKVSFESAEYTANADALGTLRILEAVRILGLEKKTRFYQASTSELYGKVREVPQSERTPFYPRSPYGVAKLYGYWITVNYREAYNLFACNGILFNHESPIRGETFVTRKITRAAARIALGLQRDLYLGNLDALRDWGHAKDFVRAQWLILQQESPDDYVIATGEQHSVREFCELAFAELGIELEWKGKGVSEQGIIAGIHPSPLLEKYSKQCRQSALQPGQVLVQVDPNYFRPAEVETLLGDPSKANRKLDWQPQITFNELVREMVTYDVHEAMRDAICKRNGFDVPASCEIHM